MAALPHCRKAVEEAPSAAVPEAAALVLLNVGDIGLIGWVRRRRKVDYVQEGRAKDFRDALTGLVHGVISMGKAFSLTASRQ